MALKFHMSVIGKMNIPEQYQDPLFNAFWRAYPHKVGKMQAIKAWKKLEVNEDDLQVILTAIERQKKEPLWSQGIGIPHPATYLNQARFLDEPIPVFEQKKTNSAWQRTDEGIIAKGRELGMEARVGELMPQFLQRIINKLDCR